MTFASMPGLLEELEDEEIGNSLVVREPLGVVAAITPWNYPLHQIAAKVAPALAAGCTVVLKPSEDTPLCAFALAEICDEVGLPAGVLNLVTGYGHIVGEALIGHPGVDLVTFTGSEGVGRQIGEVTGRNLVPAALELGGKSACIVLDDADLELAVTAVRHALHAQQRPDVHRADAAAGPARAARRSRGDRGRGRRGARRSATRSTPRRRWARSSRPSSAAGSAITSAAP